MTASTPTIVAPQFDDARQQHLAATLGMWAFLATEVLFFGGMFAGYAVYRHWYPEVWSAASRHLDMTIGTINTAVLLSSSLTMAFAVHAAQANDPHRSAMRLLGTLCLGAAFLGVKAFEYYEKWRDDLIPGDNFRWHVPSDSGPAVLFYSFYFAMTGCHALHMLIGMGVLLMLFVQLRRRTMTNQTVTTIEMTGLYWHFVDAIWVFLFPLLYLIDRS